MTRPRRTTSASRAVRDGDAIPASSRSATPAPAETVPAAPVAPGRTRRKGTARKAAAPPLAKTPDPATAEPAKAVSSEPATKPRRKPRPSRSVAAETWQTDEFIFESDPALSEAASRRPARPRRQPQPDAPQPVERAGLAPLSLTPTGGEAAQERARIRAGMQQIRQLIDGPARPGSDAMLMLQRLCHDPAPRRGLAGSTAVGLHVVIVPPMPAKAPLSQAEHAIRSRRLDRARRAMMTMPVADPAALPDQRSAPDDMPSPRMPAPWMPDIRMPATLVPQQPVSTPFSVFRLAPPADLPAAAPAMVPPVREQAQSLLTAWAGWLMWKLQPPRIPQAAPATSPDAAMTGVVSSTAGPGHAPGSGGTAGPSVPGDIGGMDLSPPDGFDMGPGRGGNQDAGALDISGPPSAAAQDAGQPPAAIALTAEAIAQALQMALGDGTLRDQLQAMIRDELAGEMGARFSSNLQAVIRREIATGLDDRLTHL